MPSQVSYWDLVALCPGPLSPSARAGACDLGTCLGSAWHVPQAPMTLLGNVANVNIMLIFLLYDMLFGKRVSQPCIVPYGPTILARSPALGQMGRPNGKDPSYIDLSVVYIIKLQKTGRDTLLYAYLYSFPAPSHLVATFWRAQRPDL